MKKYRMTFNSLDAALSGFCNDIGACVNCPLDGKTTGKSCLEYCLAHPEEVAKLMGLEVVEVEDPPKLTEQELAICKAVGAKWVSRDEHDDLITLWESKPSLFPGVASYYTDGGLITHMHINLFPSLKAGDCVNVEELLKGAEP